MQNMRDLGLRQLRHRGRSPRSVETSVNTNPPTEHHIREDSNLYPNQYLHSLVFSRLIFAYKEDRNKGAEENCIMRRLIMSALDQFTAQR